MVAAGDEQSNDEQKMETRTSSKEADVTMRPGARDDGSTTSKDATALTRQTSGHDRSLSSRTANSAFLAEAADMETRLREHVLELVQPTIKKQGNLELRIKDCRAMIDARAQEMADLRTVKEDAERIYRMVEMFRNEMSEWDTQRRAEEQEAGDRLSLQESEINTLRKTLERSAADSSGFSRALKVVGGELTTAREETRQLRTFVVERLDVTRDKGAKLRDEFERRMSETENQLHKLQDSQSSADNLIHKFQQSMDGLSSRVLKAEENIADIWRNKASVAALEQQQQDLSEFMRHVNGTVSGLKQQFGSLIDNVKSHFQEAANVVGTNTAAQLEDMRAQYKEDLTKVDVVQEDVQVFFDKATKNQDTLQQEVAGVRDAAKLGIDALQKDFQDLEKKRKIGEDHVFVELSQLRKNISDLQATVEVQERMAMTEVLEKLVDCSLLSAHLDLQDDSDRKNIALFGYKGADHSREKVGALPEVDRCHGGSMSARGSRRRPQGLGSPIPTKDDSTGIGPIMSLDKRCLSCCGTQETVLAGFKMACLSYAPGQIELGRAVYSRAELISQRMEMLKLAKDQLHSRQHPQSGRTLQ